MKSTFLASEAFWMEQIIAALITAVVSLVIALIAVAPALKSLRDRLDHRADNLARDYEAIQKEIHAENWDLQQCIGQVASATSFLRDARLKDDARRELLKGQEVDIQKVVDTLLSQQNYINDLMRENARLKEENQKYKQQLLVVTSNLTQQNSCDPDLEA